MDDSVAEPRRLPVKPAAGTDVEYTHQADGQPHPAHRLLSGQAQKIKALEEAILNVPPKG